MFGCPKLYGREWTNVGVRGYVWMPKIVWTSGYVWTQFVGYHVRPNMGANGRPNLREFMGAHVLTWPHFRECFVGAHDTWRWMRKMGAPTMRRPCPGHVHEPILTRPLPTKLFTRRLCLTRQVFQKFLAKMFGNQQLTTLYLQRPKSTSAGVRKYGNKFFDMIDYATSVV